MFDYILAHEAAVRMCAFAGVLAALLVLEALLPRRGGDRLRRLRWGANLPMVVAGALLVRMVLPLGAAGVALWARQQGVGLFNVLAVPNTIAEIASFLALDAAIYGQHRLFHRVPAFWRIHRMHHSDVEFDATTALRFHPLEIALSMGIKLAVVIALGAPPVIVILFEIALNATDRKSVV